MPDLPPLVSTQDEAWTKFQANDPDWYMDVAGQAIRTYCGWHIAPNQTVTAKNLPIQSRGMITLPSMLVTAVHAVIMEDPSNETNNTPLDPTQYEWSENGIIEPIGWQYWSSYGGYYYGPENWSYLPVYQMGLATAVFDSGYETLPSDVAQVAYELVTTTMEVSAGNIKEVQTPGYRLQLAQAYGATLNPDQKNRLASYRLPAVK